MTGSNASRPRVLLLAPDIPRRYGGGVRAYHFARALTEVADLDLVVLLEEHSIPIPEDLPAGCASVIQLPAGFRQAQSARLNHSRSARAWRVLTLPLIPWKHYGQDLVMGASGRALELAQGYTSPARRLYATVLKAEVDAGIRWFGLAPERTMERRQEFDSVRPALERAIRERPPDVIWFEHSTMYPYAARLRARVPGARLVCNAHNIEYSLHDRLSRVAPHPHLKRWLATQAEACRRLERRAFNACDLIFCCSATDANLARRLAPGSSTAAIPNGVDTAYFRPGQVREAGPQLLFTGGMGYEPNRDAVRHFVAEILPLIRREIPKCRFCVAGSEARHCAPLAASDPLIEIAADVPDMRPYFDAAGLVVVPLRAGSGTRTKILEAMAMERAVVSTTLGAEGIALTPERHLCLADEPAAFAGKVIALLRDAPRRRDMELEGRQLVCERYDWEKLTAEAMNIFQQKC